MIGKYVIVRSRDAGVFAGTIAAKDGNEVTLTGARKLWYWDGASETLQIAAEGVKKPQNCKFTLTVDEICLQNVIEVIPATAEAEANIKAVPVWKA
jgi:hypothetical protein